MIIRQLGSFMRAIITVQAALLSLLFVAPAWANPPTLSVLPTQVIEVPALSEPQQKPVAPPVPSRGQLLYENHCMACHESVVHIRTQQQTQSLPALREQVLKWAAYEQLSWSKEEVDDVVDYLNSQYYKFESRQGNIRP